MQTETARRWAQIIAESERSALSQREFAARRGLNARTLAWWKWRLRQDDADGIVGRDPKFVELVVQSVAMTAESSVRIHIGELAYVDADENTNLEVLRRLLESIA